MHANSLNGEDQAPIKQRRFPIFHCLNQVAVNCSLIAFVFLGTTPAVFAAGAAMKVLYGHVPKTVALSNYKGAQPATNRLNLAIGLPLRDAAGLDEFLADLYDPASPNYRQYLTPGQFTERFGPTGQDYQAVIDFARQNGLTITARHGNRLLLDVRGSVAQVESAFHVHLNVYRHPTEARDFYAPDADPSVEDSLPIADVSGLSNFGRPHPQNLLKKPSVVPETGTGSGSGGTYLGYDFRNAYLPDVTLTGSGQMLGLLEFDGYYASDIAGYESTAGLPDVPLQTVLLDGFNGVPTTGANSGNGEVSLDIEMAASMAPGLAKIVVFEAGPSGLQNDILNAMVASNQVSQLSCSWGWGGGPTNTTDTIFKEMAAQGQSFFSAAGDSDAFTTGATSANGVDNPSLNNAPASCPYITVVGGTTLTTTGPGGSWSSETVWNWGLDKGSYVGTSGGISSYYSIPTWQTNVSMASNGGSTTKRNVPDVALTADNVYTRYGNGSSSTSGGTSCAAPLWAGLAALMNQQSVAAGRSVIGFINPAVYAIGKSASYSVSFHDITTGNNVSSDSPSAFYAVSGYDLCTGWGTPAGQTLINAIAGAPDPLGLSTATGFTSSGTVGGPFSTTNTVFQLTNNSTASLTWSVINTSAWLQVSTTGGTLASGGTASLSASLNSTAETLAAGTYTTSLKFTNWESHVAQTAPFTLRVVSSLVQNGGFETGDFTDWTLVGNTTTQGFRGATIYNAVESSNSYPLVVHSGTYGAFLGDNQLAFLSQTLTTVPGENYLLSFWLDNRTSAAGQRFQVSWNGGLLYNVTNPPAFTWTNLQFIANAASPSTVLQFGVENDPNYFGLDDISVTRIPAVTFNAVTPTAGTLKLNWATAAGTNLTTTDTRTSPQRFYRLVVSP